MGIIYAIKNNINSKVYIGQTKNSLVKRFSQHKGNLNRKELNSTLYLEMRKYGTENFFIEELEKGEFTEEEMDKKENYYIKKFDSLEPNGYNIRDGGKSSKMAESSKKKISMSNKGREIYWKDKISSGVKKLWENEDYRQNQIEQRHNKRGNYRKGIIHEKARKMIDIENFTKDYHNYMNLHEMSIKHNVSVNTIYKIIKRENIEKRGYRCHKEK